MLGRDVLDALPLGAAGGLDGAGPTVAELGVEACPEPKVAGPREPPSGLDKVVDEGLHNYSSGEFLPGPAQVSRELEPNRVVVRVGDKGAVLDDDGGGLATLLAALGGDDALLVVHRTADDEAAVLEDCGGVAEDEVDGAGDVAVAVELALGVGVKGVLVAVHGAPVEDHLVGVHSQRHRLVLVRSGGVLEADIPRSEMISQHHCFYFLFFV